MAKENGFWCYVKKAKAIITIAAILVGLIAWFLTMGGKIDQAEEINIRQDKTAEAIRHCVSQNTQTLVKVGTKLDAVDENIKRIDRRQEAIRRETTDRLDRILDKVK